MVKPERHRAPDSTLYPVILESIDEGVFTVDAGFRITSFNAAAERITGMKRDAALGRKCYEVFRSSICQTECAMRQTLRTGKAVRDMRIDVLDSRMRTVPIRVSTAALRDGEEMIGGVEIFRDISDVETLRSELRAKRPLEGIVGNSEPMQAIFRLLPDVAASHASVLLEGPTGTGKELIARALHQLSPRSHGPFVQVNCAALPDSLLESELFGYVKGAFTGAQRDKPGRFQLAHGGTLFLDEIGDISPAFQAKLLRVLQNGEFEALGATRPTRVDVRLITATHRDLEAQVREARFREDLYYRVRVVPIRLPALRDRREDILLLVDHFLKRFSATTGNPIHDIHPEAQRVIMAHAFPGNVRELENGLERAFVLCRQGRIEVEHLPPEWSQARSPQVEAVAHARWADGHAPRFSRIPSGDCETLRDQRSEPDATSPLHASMMRNERELLVATLDAHRWNRTETARVLGIARNTLWRRMKLLGLIP